MTAYTLSDFDFNLPEQLIAQFPTDERSHSRLLCPLLGEDKNLSGFLETQFSQITEQFQADDVLVVNNTKVIPARLFANKLSGGKIEVFVERITENNSALCMIRANRAPKVGSEIVFANGIKAKVIDKKGQFYLLTLQSNDWSVLLETEGEVPLPPYIQRQVESTDDSRYQTIYAKQKGAVAAPTAGLHFDEKLFAQLKQKGVEIVEVTLHVGAGTFLPIKEENIANHQMHFELFNIPPSTAEIINAAKQRGRQITAVGTTSLRTLESSVDANGWLTAGQGDTNLFITPGFQFQIVDRLITNFHLPKSSLLLLVSAFAGYDLIRQTYQYAIENQYRFFSYGDAMLLEKSL